MPLKQLEMAKEGTNKLLDIRQVLTDFEGKPLKFQEVDGQVLADRPDTTLKHVLLRALASANNSSANLTDAEKMNVYDAGKFIGIHQGSDPVELNQQQYDVIKKIIDNGKVKVQNQEIDLFTLVEQQQIKQMVDAAENVK